MGAWAPRSSSKPWRQAPHCQGRGDGACGVSWGCSCSKGGGCVGPRGPGRAGGAPAHCQQRRVSHEQGRGHGSKACTVAWVESDHHQHRGRPYLPLGTTGKLWSGPSDVIFLNFAYLLIVYVMSMDIVYYLSMYSHSLSENECEQA